MSDILKLSPSSLNLYLECPRCFWLRFKKGIHRPEGPSSTLPRGMDYTLKNHYDNWRKKGLPPELQDKINGRLIKDIETIREMRRTSFGIQINDGVWFGGALDEALELPDGSIIPLDNKTRGFPPKETHWTYGAQMSGYTLILREKGYETKNIAYLVFWFLDHKNMNLDDPLAFRIICEAVKTDPDKIMKKIHEATNALRGDMPAPGKNSGANGGELCPFCAYRDQLCSIE
ncbi:MAG: hypothetical protein A2934_01670 [Candidatus Sungbacteria bacterium RIFCSPLOWO2_01_FULL_47_10]|uniref:PD-(D/E)XK endonuclease-like domain-containing protein n=1 Tax=Candidatus Sungbacteria bacterium RIFCSPLOWO2_01_FULL_47_10 TaxID=1802276 RepID=A0A1G2KYQ7_9BACT|nr:MAG: hypothetical protein A2934_01670 [Candidatus Sungbacteria bacterium RIFCSPLOWO2_01_FULL_47_10]